MNEGTHRVIMGLGNPGVKYRFTRHNLGQLVVETVAERLGWKFKEEKGLGLQSAKGKRGITTLHLIIPLTYMNESGRAARNYLEYYKLSVKDLAAIMDDTALPFGQLRIRKKGSSGGHNGLKSIEECLGTQEYMRLKIGIGRHNPDQELADYVLEKFTEEERRALPSILDAATAIVLQL